MRPGEQEILFPSLSLLFFFRLLWPGMALEDPSPLEHMRIGQSMAAMLCVWKAKVQAARLSPWHDIFYASLHTWSGRESHTHPCYHDDDIERWMGPSSSMMALCQFPPFSLSYQIPSHTHARGERRPLSISSRFENFFTWLNGWHQGHPEDSAEPARTRKIFPTRKYKIYDSIESSVCPP